MKEENAHGFQLTKNKKTSFIIGACLLIYFVSASNTTLNVLQTPMLQAMDKFEMFPVVGALGTIGVCIMTPIGGKLGDIFGRRNVILVGGLLSVISSVCLAFLQDFSFYLIFRVLGSIAQGTFIAAPYILVSQIFEKKDVPKNMGLISSSMALGQFLGSFIAGILSDKGLTTVAIILPTCFLILALILIGYAIPNVKSPHKIIFDFKGALLLVGLIVSMVLTLNFGNKIGWTSPIILTGAVLTVIFIVCLIKVEEKLEEANGSPIISIKTLKNKNYSILLIIGITAYTYQSTMLSYGPMASINVLGTSATLAGSLTMPRTIITLILPTFVGVWLGKKQTNSWKAIAIATGLITVCLMPMLFISSNTPYLVVLISFSLTGIAESFRSVSVTPTAQQYLTPETIASGTALINFSNSFAPVFSSSISGALFQTAGSNTALGIRLVFGFACAIAFLGFLLTVTFVRKQQINKFADNGETTTVSN